MTYKGEFDPTLDIGDAGQQPSSGEQYVEPVPTQTTTYDYVYEVIYDYSPESLAAYEEDGAVAVAVYEDGTEEVVEWSEVFDPTEQSEDVADEAADAAEAANQHFWYDTNGAHVTDNEQDDWNEEYAKTGHGELDNPTAQKPWHNILMNSLGILLRTGLRNLVSITQTAVGFFDGRGNAAGNVVASFGREGAIVGKTAGLHTEVTSSGIAMKDGNTTLCAFGTNATMDIANIQTLNVGSAVAESIIAESLNAQSSTIGTLQANKANVSDLTAATARIGALESDHVTVSDFQAEQANIDSLQSATADIATIRANSAKVANLTAAQLEADHATVGSLSTTYAQIDGANITNLTASNGWLDKIMVQTGMIAHQGTVYTLDAIQVNATNITAGTIDVERLIVTVDGEKYLVHVEDGTPTYEKLDGGIVEPRTITADKIVAGAITAQEITTENLVGSGGWINLRNGTFQYVNAQTGDGIVWDGSHLTISGSATIGSGQKLADLLNAISYDMTWTKSNGTYTFTGYAYKGGIDVSAEFPTELYEWYLRNESGESFLGTGRTRTVAQSMAGYHGTVVGALREALEGVLGDEGGNEIVTDAGDNIGIYCLWEV